QGGPGSGGASGQAGSGQAEQLTFLAVRRILMLHSIILSIGGIPLIYLGDEVGTLNDYSYASDPAKADDSRWVHRPAADWDQRTLAQQSQATPGGWIFAELRRLIRLRTAQPAIWDGTMEVIESGNPHVFGFVRHHGGQRLLVMANFSEHPQEVDRNRVRVYGPGYHFTDLISGSDVSAESGLSLEPYQYVWLEAQ
ncbi:MAG TPA: alpha-glucosidase C-terminal domain-containing protein, partial [Roseiflexaceae bacterium]|nr:alpha-glucosidase C-terminal domain-containing protein [Roseiflexaceae bacterium]